MFSVKQDLIYAIRTLTSARGFTLTAVLTLALGIGANTAIFSVMSGVLLRPQPYRSPDRLVFLWSSSETLPRETLTPGRLVDFRQQLTTVSGVAGISQIPLTLTGSGDPERLAGSSVSSNFFDVIGAPALHGDPFHAGRADDSQVVLSHGLWTRRFAADPSIVGRQITLNGSARTVVAVMPAEFDWPTVTATPGRHAGPELWIPGTVEDIPRTPVDQANLATNRRIGYLRAVARLKDGVTIEQARLEAQAIAGRLAREYPLEDGGRGATFVALDEQFFGSLRQPMAVLLGAVAFVLAIACANIASLLLGRGAVRRRELAVRVALGATRARVMRQLLTESMVLASVSAVAGTLAAWWGLQWLIRVSPGSLPGIDKVAIDGRVLLFTIGLTIVTGVLCGLLPAVHASIAAIGAGLGETSTRSSAGRRAGRTRDALVAVQIGVALVLLVGAGLLLRSFTSLSQVDTGIRTANLLTFDLFLSGERARQQPLQRAFYDRVLQRISVLPGVIDAAAAVTLPIGGDAFAAPVRVEGAADTPPGQEPRAGFQSVTPGYFRTLGVALVAGRDFSESDVAAASPVAMVNETFARLHWPGQHPIGRRMRVAGGDGGWMTVVGLVRDIRHLGPASPPRPEFYRPHTQLSFSFMAFVVRTQAAPQSIVPAIRAAITSLDAAQPIAGVNTMEQHLAGALARPKFLSTLIAIFGTVALLLSAVGVYGVMAYAVAQRTREIAIRTALGATRTEVLRLIVGKAVWLAALGIVAGLAGSTLLSRALSGLLFGVGTADPLTYAVVIGLLSIVALAAAAMPAWRATRIPSAEVLR